jgi:hypothetical protein
LKPCPPVVGHPEKGGGAWLLVATEIEVLLSVLRHERTGKLSLRHEQNASVGCHALVEGSKVAQHAFDEVLLRCG